MAFTRILIHSGKHPFEPFDYTLDYTQMMAVSGKNLGNFLFADSVFKYLYTSEACELKSDHYRLLSDEPDVDADLINREYDCVVIPAANWLGEDNRPWLRSYADKIRKLKIPCVVTGLGVQAASQGDFSFLSRFSEEAKEFLSAVSDRSESISVRGEFTGQCLKKLGFRNVNITGCPSFYRNLRTLSVSKKRVDRDSFRLAVNGNKVLLGGLRKELFDKYNAMLFSQGDILKVMKGQWSTPWPDLKFVLSDGFTIDLISRDRVRYYGDITPWIEELKNYDFSIGTRIHGNIIALLAGIPGMVIAHDSRTSEMAEFYKIPCVSLHSLKKGFDPYDLYQAADYTAMEAQYPSKLANMARFLESNGLQHTLFQENGTTYYDAKIRTVSFNSSPDRFGGPFLTVAGALSSVFTRLKTFKRKMVGRLAHA